MSRLITIYRLLISFLIFLPVLCSAASPTWEAFDYKNCRHWSIADDYEGSGDDYQKAIDVAKKLNQAGAPEVWVIFGSEKLYEYNEIPEYGVCNISVNSVRSGKTETTTETIACHSDTAFPLGGATFFGNAEDKTFKCIKGCKNNTIKMLYELGI